MCYKVNSFIQKAYSSHFRLFTLISTMLYTRGKFKANLNQHNAIVHPSAPLMILAGAGTGKTSTLIHRIIYMIEQLKISPASILTITFTEKAANELKDRIIREVGQKAESMTVSTFHAFCYSIVKQFAYPKNSPPRLMEEGDALFLLLNQFDKLAPFESTEFPLDPVKAVASSFIPFFNRVRDELLDLTSLSNPPEDEHIFTPEILAQLNDLKRIYPIFQHLKKEQNRVDYGDMILHCFELMQADSTLVKHLAQQYKHIIVDEFQDNNFALNEVIGKIADNHGSITVVGDEDQIIYSFRGASGYNIKNFRQRYHNHKNYLEISLEENFRSHLQILEVANNVIQKNTGRIEKVLKPFKGRTGPIPEIWWGNKTEQNAFVPEKINELIQAGAFTYQDMAILCRTRNQVKEMAGVLKRAHLPVLAYLTEYFQIPVIRDLLAWCHLISESKYADTALYRVFKKYLSGKSLYSLFKQFDKRDTTPRLDLIHAQMKSLPEEIQHNLELPLELIKRLKQDNHKKPAGEMVWEICEKNRIFRPLINRDELNDQISMLNLGDFIQRAQSFTKGHEEDPSLRAFTYYMDTLQNAASVQTQYPVLNHHRSGILVQTIHGVKGGEFPVVFLPYNQTGSFPLNYRPSANIDQPPDVWLAYSQTNNLTSKEQHYQEERRLFYVGVTRTQERLFILAPKKRTSQFVKKDLSTSLTQEFTMESVDQNHAPPTFGEVRQRYEIRLTNALAMDQFEKAQDILLGIKRIAALERNDEVIWETAAWEIELKQALSPEFVPDPKKRLFLSASSLETYTQCPLKFRFGNVDKIPETASKPQLTFGNIIHRVLEQFHDEDTPQTEERLLQLLEDYWDSEGFDYLAREEKFKQQGVELLKRYIQFITANPPNIAARELSFSFEIEDITIRGKIDRIDHGDHGFRVLDYKTSKTSSPAKKSLQLGVYSLYLNQAKDVKFGGLPESAGLFFLREENDPLKTHTFNHEELLEIRNKILEVGDGIRKGNYSAKKGFHCTWCDYKTLLCPAWEIES